MANRNTTIEVYDRYAREYDEMQHATVPHYDDIVSMVADAFHRHVSEGSFLDLGCGSGNTSLAILERSPGSKSYLLDGSRAMVELARSKIEATSGAGTIAGSKVANLEDRDWYSGIGGPFDAVVTSFVLEHLKEEDYLNVVAKCRELLRPGGAFVSVEWSDDEHGMQHWFIERMKAKQKAHPEYSRAIEDAKVMEHHYFVNIREKLEWLKDAGFRDAHTVWQYLFGYVVVGHR